MHGVHVQFLILLTQRVRISQTMPISLLGTAVEQLYITKQARVQRVTIEQLLETGGVDYSYTLET